MTRTTTVTCLALALGLFSARAPAQQETGDFGNAKQTTLKAVYENPAAYKNVWIRFSGWFCGIGSLHNPFFTRFTRSEYTNFMMWGDSQKIWEKDAYDKPCVTLFVLKTDDDSLKKVSDLQRYRRITCTGIVRNVFRNQPWIEVTKIEVENEKLTTTTLAHMVRARRFMAARKWSQAAAELNRAKASEQTPFIMGWIHNYLAVCYMRVGQIEKAKVNAALASSFLPKEYEIAANRKALLENPKGVVDLKVANKNLPKSKRPMWEVLEDRSRVGSNGTTGTKKSGGSKPASPSK